MLIQVSDEWVIVSAFAIAHKLFLYWNTLDLFEQMFYIYLGENKREGELNERKQGQAD